MSEILELTRDEIAARLEHGARKRLGMSADEMVRAYREGRLSDPGAVADLLALAHLLEETDSLFVST